MPVLDQIKLDVDHRAIACPKALATTAIEPAGELVVRVVAMLMRLASS